MRMRPRREHLLDGADIVLVLLHAGYSEECGRCGRPVHVRGASGLCVWCFNGVGEARRPPLLPAPVVLRAAEQARRAPHLSPAPAG